MNRDGFVLILALVLPSVAAWGYFVAAASPSGADAGGPQAVLVVYALSKIGQFTLPLAWILATERSRLRWCWPSREGVCLGVGFAGVVSAVLLGLYFTLLRDHPLLAETPQRLRDKVQEFGVASPARFLLLAGFIAGIHSLLEEYYWRWFVYAGLRRCHGRFAAVIVSSLGFMGHHVIVLNAYFPGRFLDATVPLSLAVAVGGAVWALLYERSRSLLGPWLSHALIDAAIMIVGFDLLFRSIDHLQ